MNNNDIIQELIEKIVKIEKENMESVEAENNEIRGRIVNAILLELDKVVTNGEN